MLKSLTEASPTSLHQSIISVQAGNIEEENECITNYYPFIRKTVSGVCKRFIHPGTDEEFSIGLLAFREALHQFEPNKGTSFLAFARLVIKRRIIDYIRREQRRVQAVSLDYRDEQKESLENAAEVIVSLNRYRQKIENEARKEELLMLEEKLALFHVSLSEVAEQRPLHCDARQNMVRVAKRIYEHKAVLNKIYTKKRLPMNQLMEIVDMSRKTIERNRKYILALVIVMTEGYQHLYEYVK
ncbi:RNA polymerase sigma-I factor [Bacillus daqingensis]|uniref:RNA polymerase sigma factor SigI n=1 Tax=Bacillus daqingensis TaxID=872396 RepID=A0ABV9NQZ5_9BACI